MTPCSTLGVPVIYTGFYLSETVKLLQTPLTVFTGLIPETEKHTSWLHLDYPIVST